MPESPKSTPLLVAAAWSVVVLPTAWGLSYTIKSAMKLFVVPPAAAAAPSTSAHEPATAPKD